MDLDRRIKTDLDRRIKTTINNEKEYDPELEIACLEGHYKSLLKALTNCDDDMARIKLLSIMISHVTTIHMLKKEDQNG